MTNLLTYQIHRKYLPETKEAILNTKVSFPKGILNQGVLLKDFGALERANEIPIALYYIKPPDKSNKNSNVTITCLRAPKPSIIRQYGGIDKVCCLALISTDHVVYIPDIFAYNKSVINRCKSKAPVGRPLKDRRCPFCFGLLHSREMLLNHIDSGVCISMSSQPARIIMPPPGSVINHEINGATESPLITLCQSGDGKIRQYVIAPSFSELLRD